MRPYIVIDCKEMRDEHLHTYPSRSTYIGDTAKKGTETEYGDAREQKNLKLG